jgi:hypothetical protein
MGGKTGASRFGQGVKESTDPIPPLQLSLGATKGPTLSNRNRLAAEEISGDAADSRYLKGQTS